MKGMDLSKMTTYTPPSTQKLALLAILTAIVVVLQFFGAFVKFGLFSVSLVLMPIVVGAALIGSLAGGWLGLLFGVVVLASGDANAFLEINPAGAVLVVILKGMLAGLAAGSVYRLLSKMSKTIGAVAAAVVCPIVNTGLFIIGSYVFFLPALTKRGMEEGFTSVTAFIFVGLIGVNFLFELGLNVLLSPAIVRLIQFGQDRLGRGKTGS